MALIIAKNDNIYYHLCRLPPANTRYMRDRRIIMTTPSELKIIEQRLLWLSHWMIHSANHIRP